MASQLCFPPLTKGGMFCKGMLRLGCGYIACIPPETNRLEQRTYHKDLYKERNQLEPMFGKLKTFRRITIRYDKLIKTCMGFVKHAEIYRRNISMA